MNSELDANVNYFNEVYPSLAESGTNQYYTNETFNWLTAHGTGKYLTLIHANIRSLKANGDLLVRYLSTLNQVSILYALQKPD